MFKYWMLCLCYVFPLVVLNAETLSQQDELKAIEEEIQVLKKRWHQINLKEMKDEVEGQGLMIADWEGYRRELEQIRQLEKEDDQIEQRIKKLEERKIELIKQQPHLLD